MVKEGLQDWIEAVGPEKSKKWLTQGSRRGNAAHEMIENYVFGYPEKKRMPNELDLFLRLKRAADKHLDNIICVEGQMVSDFLRSAGTVDMVAEWDGRMSIIDWKTARKPREDDWAESYFIQESAYAVMFEENTGIPVDTLVTVVSCESGETQIFVRKRDKWIGEFIKLRDAMELPCVA
tara:strand:- start:6466 stop:7002 length:537 start_codon:yes stop_codon:yes gene_type:complete